MKNKVFGVGFHRSGTTSFQTALEHLGYSVVGMRSSDWQAYVNEETERLFDTISNFDGFRDMPWPLLYEWLYWQYPSAKFVLTYREPERWIQSVVGNYNGRYHEMFPVIYGVDRVDGNEGVCKGVYMRHNEQVSRFFSDKPGQLLEIDFEREPSWQKLCSFLGEPVPSRAFPHANNRPKTFPTRLKYALLRRVMPETYRKIVRDR